MDGERRASLTGIVLRIMGSRMVGNGLPEIMAYRSPWLPKPMGKSGPDDLKGIEWVTQPFARLVLGATQVGMLARSVKVPYAVALVMGGLLLEESHVTHVPDLNPTVLLFVVLPPLLFHATFRLGVRELRVLLRPVLALTLPAATPVPNLLVTMASATMAFGVVLFTRVVQGLALPTLIGRVGLGQAS